MSKSRRERARVTQLKIRAVPLERMPKSRFFMLIKEACRTGVVPPGIRLTTLNWDHGIGQSFEAGEVLSADNAAELRNCARFLFGPQGKHDVRVEHPS